MRWSRSRVDLADDYRRIVVVLGRLGREGFGVVGCHRDLGYARVKGRRNLVVGGREIGCSRLAGFEVVGSCPGVEEEG